MAGIILIVLSLSGIAGAMGNVAKKEKLSRYIDNGNGTITDTKTGLMWASKDNGSKINWQDARSYCQNYNGGGHTDWRMPTLKELAGLYDKKKPRKHRTTPLIKLSNQYIWGVETAPFTFIYGRRGFVDQSLTDGGRTLPVRNTK